MSENSFTWPDAFTVVGSVVAVCVMIVMIVYFGTRYSDEDE